MSTPDANIAEHGRQERLEQLKQAAEAQMRRPAPAIGSTRAAKRQRTEDGDAAGESAAARVSRYNYAAPEALLSGSTCFLITCGLSRQMSATKEGVELIKKKLPPGAHCSLVKVGCRGLVLVLVQQQQPQQQQEEEKQQQQEEDKRCEASKPLNMVDIAASILADVESKAAAHARHVQRVIPAQVTCAMTADALRGAAERLCQEYVEGLGEGQLDHPVEFAVAFKNRGFEGAADEPAASTSGRQQQAAHQAVGEQQQGGSGADEQQQQQQQQQEQEQQQLQGAGGDEVPTQPGAAQQPVSNQPVAPLQRQEAIAILADAMSKASGGRSRVNLKSPAVTVIAEVVPVSLSGRQQLVVALAVADTSKLMSVKAKGLQIRNICK